MLDTNVICSGLRMVDELLDELKVDMVLLGLVMKFSFRLILRHPRVLTKNNIQVYLQFIQQVFNHVYIQYHHIVIDVY